MNVNGSKFFFENGKIRQRKQRTKSSQHEIYVRFMEQYPEFATGSVDAHNCDALWNELASMLNSNGLGPVKSAKAWRLTLTNWKHQVRYKARKLEDPANNNKPQTAWGRLNSLEERALIAWGGVGVSMDRMQEPLYNCQIKVDESPPESRAGDFDDDDVDEDDDEGNASDHSEIAPKRRKQEHDLTNPPTAVEQPKMESQLNGNQNTINTLSAVIRATEESKIHAQTKMAEAMNHLADGLRKFAEAMNTMVEANLSQMGLMLQIVKAKPNN